MPKQKRPKPLYQRGTYRLVARPGRANLEIIWYDPARGRERSASAGTADIAAGRTALDQRFVADTGGEAFCPACGQPRANGGVFVSTAIADYLALMHGTDKEAAVRPRLSHVLAFLADTGRADARCGQVDERWIEQLRAFLAARPIVSPKGAERPRTLSTIENSVIQLQAAINRCGGVRAGFRPIQTRELNRTPQYRADVPALARMFAWCVSPQPREGRTWSPEETARRRHERRHLLAFLRLGVATLGRPDAVLDISTDPARGQWNSQMRVLNLNPAGRRQTRKYRATVPLARQAAAILDSTKGALIPVNAIRSAWDSMAADLGLPGNGEAGAKLIRRSMANIVRQRLPQEAWGELEIFLGHDRFDGVSDLYAPFSPDYLRRALAVIESVIEEIEAGAPGAFYRIGTAEGGNLIRLGSAKKLATSEA